MDMNYEDRVSAHAALLSWDADGITTQHQLHAAADQSRSTFQSIVSNHDPENHGGQMPHRRRKYDPILKHMQCPRWQTVPVAFERDMVPSIQMLKSDYTSLPRSTKRRSSSQKITYRVFELLVSALTWNSPSTEHGQETWTVRIPVAKRPGIARANELLGCQTEERIPETCWRRAALMGKAIRQLGLGCLLLPSTIPYTRWHSYTTEDMAEFRRYLERRHKHIFERIRSSNAEVALFIARIIQGSGLSDVDQARMRHGVERLCETMLPTAAESKDDETTLASSVIESEHHTLTRMDLPFEFSSGYGPTTQFRSSQILGATANAIIHYREDWVAKPSNVPMSVEGQVFGPGVFYHSQNRLCA